MESGLRNVLARDKDKTGFLLNPGVSELHSQAEVWSPGAALLPAKKYALNLDSNLGLEEDTFGFRLTGLLG